MYTIVSWRKRDRLVALRVYSDDGKLVKLERYPDVLLLDIKTGVRVPGSILGHIEVYVVPGEAKASKHGSLLVVEGPRDEE